MPRDNVVSAKSFAFAVRAVRCYQHLARRMDAAPIAKQFLQAATAIGANLPEAQDAQSHADVVSKSAIALKEAREADYWIRLMAATDLLTEAEAASLSADGEELLQLLTSIVKTARSCRTHAMPCHAMLWGNTFHIRSRKGAKGAKNRIHGAALRLCAS